MYQACTMSPRYRVRFTDDIRWQLNSFTLFQIAASGREQDMSYQSKVCRSIVHPNNFAHSSIGFDDYLVGCGTS